MYKMFAPLLGAAALFASAQAATMTFTDETNYTSATGPVTFVIDFDGLTPGANDGDFAGVDFGSPEASNPGNILFGSDALTDAGSTTADNSVGPISAVFDAPAFAFSLEFLSSGNPQTIELYDAANALIGTVVTPNAGFFGVLSDIAIASIIIRNGEFSPNVRDRFFIDNFTVSAAPSEVPLPSAALLFAGGAFMMRSMRKKRKTA